MGQNQMKNPSQQPDKEKSSNEFSAPKTPVKEKKGQPKISKFQKHLNNASNLKKLPRSNSIPDLERQSMIEKNDELEATGAKKHTVNFLEPMHDQTKF